MQETRMRKGEMKNKEGEGIKDTHENHPIPQPKHGSCFSYIPDGKSSASLIRVYLPFSGSAVSVACPTMTTIPLTCLDIHLIKKSSFYKDDVYPLKIEVLYISKSESWALFSSNSLEV